MSLHHLAENLKNQGRGKDTELVHMTKGEVAGLHALALAHGGSLTTNPTTGLTEAGFLDTILSVGGGVLGGMIGGPMGAAVGSGLGSYLGGASPQQALMSGVMGYGLSGLGGAFEQAGAQSLQQKAAEEASKQAVLDSVVQNATSSAVNIPYSEFSDFVPSTPEYSLSTQPSSTDVLGNPKPGYAQNLSGTGIVPTPAPSYMEKLRAGFDVAKNDPMQFAKDNSKYLGAAGLGAAGMMSPKQTATPGPQAKTGYAPRYTWNPQTRRYEDAPAMPYTYYANGGTVPYPAGGAGYPQQNVMDKTDFYAQSTANPTPTSVIGAAPKTDYDARITPQGDEFKAAAGAYIPKSRSVNADVYKETIDPESARQDAELMALIAKLSRDPTKYAQGGIASLGEYAAGGKLLQGPGDGMSDSIPAVIKGAKPQRAALAQGEFVIPADVVSHLGNGSTDAGAKRLYSMMDKIRMARTGSKKQGRQINPTKFMPA